MKVLCVDDTKAVHAFMKALFAGTGHDLVGVYDGQQAIDKLKADGFNNYELVLLDWEMPIKNGLETLKEIRTESSGLPVIMVTSKNDVNDINRLLEAGANEYVMKPFTKDILFEKISQVLGKEVA